MSSKMETPLVSVVIPTYNREKTIARAINSVLNQTYTNIELLVIDDNSSDNTALVMKEYLLDSRVKYIKLTQNIGGGGARNKGIKEAKGDFIAFQDSDDEWMLDKLEKQMLVFEKKSDVDVVFSKMMRILNEKNTFFPNINNAKNSINLTALLKENYIGTPTAIVKKNKLIAIGGFDKSLPRLQDWDLFIRLAQNCKIHMVEEVLCKVYLQKNSITNNANALLIAIEIFIDKYQKDLILLSKKDRSLVYERYGSLFINAGNLKQSKKYFLKGLKTSIFNAKLWIKYLTLLMGGERFYKTVQNTFK